MAKYNYDDIENKYKDIIDIAKDYMNSINDYEHNMNHVNDVLYYTKELINTLNIDIDVDVCIISAYWHDVGRIKLDKGHEELSAHMLKETMERYNYDSNLIDKCYKAIEKHKWNMTPETNEGLVIKDADKLAWIGINRWKTCLDNHQELNSIVELLPRLRDEILSFDESRKIYDRDIIELVKLLYRNN